MVTGAALATINRLPVLLLPADEFATRAASPCCRSSRIRRSLDVSVNDMFRPVSRFFDRINRPEQLAVERARGDARADRSGGDGRGRCSRLPQDVQAEAFDWPEEFFERRVWRVRRPLPGAGGRSAEAAELIRAARAGR